MLFFKKHKRQEPQKEPEPVKPDGISLRDWALKLYRESEKKSEENRQINLLKAMQKDREACVKFTGCDPYITTKSINMVNHIICKIDNIELTYFYGPYKEKKDYFRLWGKCPDCGVECMSISICDIKMLGQLLEKFEPDYYNQHRWHKENCSYYEKGKEHEETMASCNKHITYFPYPYGG